MARRRTIVAIGGGRLGGLAGDALDRFALGVAGRRLRTLLITTAWRDDQASARAALDALARVADAQLFRPEQHAPRPGAILAEHDAVWVTGGDVHHLLVRWRELGIDAALRDAWDAGVVLVGSSAGALCWFEDGVTRAADGTLGPLGDGLGLLPGSFCAHANAPDRLPAYRAWSPPGWHRGTRGRIGSRSASRAPRCARS